MLSNDTELYENDVLTIVSLSDNIGNIILIIDGETFPNSIILDQLFFYLF